MKCKKCKGNIDKKTYICDSCGTAYVKPDYFKEAVLIIFTFFFGILFLYQTISTIKAFSYESTEAVVVDISTYQDSESSTYRVNFEYKVDGHTYEAKGDVPIKEAKKGYKKTIYYNPENPEKFSWDHSIAVLVLYIAMGIFCFVGCFLFTKGLLNPRTAEEQRKIEEKINPQEATRKREYQELLKSLRLDFPLFDKVILVQYEDERITLEYENKCRAAFKNVSDDTFRELLKQTRELYKYQRDKYLSDILPENYEAEGMIRDEDLDSDYILMKHLIPGNFVPIYTENGDIYYFVEIDTTWDHWDHENGLVWVFKNDKFGAFESESDWEL